MSETANNKAAAFLPIMVAAFNVFILLFPREMTEAAKQGALLWFNNVLPSLLPFIVGANLLIALGAVRYFGAMLGPVMRPLFGVSGGGGFALAVGIMSGNPVGAKVTCELRENGTLSRGEAQRLLAFATNCGPLFILGFVAAAMLDNQTVGYFIITAHLLGAVATGLIFKYIGGAPPANTRTSVTRRRDNRPIGQLLGAAVMKSMETLLLIGGFIIIFSVLTAALDIMGAFAALASVLSPILPISETLIEGILKGALELANGASAISASGQTQLTYIALIGVISWGGLSIHAQAAASISKTDLSVGVYLLSKLLHTALSVILGLILYPAFRPSIERAQAVEAFAFPGGLLPTLTQSFLNFAYTIFAITVIIALTAAAHYVRIPRPEYRRDV
jgi:sporulation integral membrane protein YlbJ